MSYIILGGCEGRRREASSDALQNTGLVFVS